MFVSDTVLFALSMLDTGIVLFLLVYFVITLSDLECDYLNSQQCCSVLNLWVIPKLLAHLIICLLFIINSHWILALLNMPLAAWLIFELIRVPKGNVGVYDPTEIHNRGQLKKHMRDCLIHLGMYLISFFVYLYCLIISVLKVNPLKKDTPIEDPDF